MLAASYTRLALIVAFGMIAACDGTGGEAARGVATDGGPPAPTDLDQAAAHLRSAVDRTAAAVFPGAATQVEPELTGRKACDDSVTQNEDYTVRIETPADQIDAAITRTRRHWVDLGAEVQQEGDASHVPRLYAQLDGFGLGAIGNRVQQAVTIGGYTPCFPKR